MLGTIINTSCIIIGSTVGSILKQQISERYKENLFIALGLCSIALGLKASIFNMPDSNYPVLFIISLAIGSLIGTSLDLSEKFNRFVTRYSNNSRLSEGLSTAVLLFCIGTLSILGPVQSALKGDNTFLFTNSILDLVSSAVLATTYGIGIIWAAPILFCWQGSFYLIAKISSDTISTELMTELQIVGGILITASGIGILGLKDCKTINMIPSLLITIILIAMLHTFS